MINPNIKFYISDIKEIDFGGKVGYEFSGSAYAIPFEIKPTKGEHTYTTCEGCQTNLANYKKNLQDKYEGREGYNPFPFCCEGHSKLPTFKEFKRKDFDKVPEMVAMKIIYADNHIQNYIETENWYEEITDYLEWALMSFGQFPTGYGGPLFIDDFVNYITQNIKNGNVVSDGKKVKLLQYFEPKNENSKSNPTGMSLLMSTYNKWLKLFPFEMNSYFGNLKSYFEKNIHILREEPKVNKYSGFTKSQFHTKETLFEALTNITNNLLTLINGNVLYEQGLITDYNKLKLELAIGKRKLKIEQGYKNDSPNEERKYIRMINHWFSDEKEFIDEITPLLKSVNSDKIQNTNPKIEITLSEIANSENKFWKGIPMQIVITHFEILSKRKNKAGNIYLTMDQLISFLKKGFLNDNTQLKQKINCSNGEKGFIIKRFYEFFDLAVSQYGYPQRKEKFISMFLNCFDNWNKSTIAPFFKPNKTKEMW